MGAYESYEDELFVDGNNGNNANNGRFWRQATKTIQAAISLASNGYTVWVTNGTYHPSSEIFVDKEIDIRSLNGPETTTIDGGGSNRCFNLHETDSCIINGFTITHGFTPYVGGGIYCLDTNALITNCTFTGNDATGSGGGMNAGTANNCTFISNSAKNGGGMYSASANNCTFIGNEASGGGGAMYYSCKANNCTFYDNTAQSYGGGIFRGEANNCSFNSNTAHAGGAIHSGTANNCTLVNNTAEDEGGGLCDGTANNSILWGNTAITRGNDLYNSTLRFSCASDGGTNNGCITNNPLFMYFTHGDFHLQTNSPCMDTGNNIYTPAGLDLDDIPRPLDGNNDSLSIVDMGCYEYLNIFADSDGDQIPDGWEINNGLNPVIANNGDNSDADPFTDLDEYIADTNPTDAQDWLHITATSNNSIMSIYFESKSSRLYSLRANTNLIEDTWTTQIGPRVGIDGTDHFAPDNSNDHTFYILQVELP